MTDKINPKDLDKSMLNLQFVTEVTGEAELDVMPDVSVMISLENQVGLRNLLLVSSVRDLAIQLGTSFMQKQNLPLDSVIYHVGFFNRATGELQLSEPNLKIGTIESICAYVLDK